jgi:hypothetical protein
VQVTSLSVSGPATTVDVGNTLQLKATVSPSSAPQGVNWTTSDALIATVDNTGLVLGILPGPVTITARSTTDNTMYGSMGLIVTGCPAPRVVSTNPTGNVTWENWIVSPLCFDYVVSTNINMSTGTLTIEPGTIVAFEASHTMVIAGSAGLIAAGTAGDRIVLTGTQQVRGHWGGVLFNQSTYDGNRLEYITIEYAGVNAFSGSVIRANLMLVNTTTTLNEAILRESAAYGMSMSATSSLPAGSSNEFTANALGPVHAYASVVHDIVRVTAAGDNSVFDGNDRDVFDVMPNAISGTAQWSAIGVPYRILKVFNALEFRVTGQLTVAAGAMIEFEQDMGMIVRDGGKLTAIGTAAMPITFTGSVAMPGHWRGIGLQDTDSRLDHVTIEYGGRAIIGLGDQEPANLQITTGDATTPTNVTISNTTLRFSSGYGMYARSIDVTLPGFSLNTLTQNMLGAAYVDAPIVDYLLNDGTYTGNGIARVHVNTNARPLTMDATWRDLGVPYELDGRGIGTPIFNVEAVSLTLEPGVEVQFDANMGLNILNGGFNAVGTADNRIVMRPAGGPWRGIRFFESTGTLDHLTISGGGSSNWGGVAHPGQVVIASAGNPAFVSAGANTTSAPVSQYGVVFSFGPTVADQCGWLGQEYIPPPDTLTMHCPNG